MRWDREKKCSWRDLLKLRAGTIDVKMEKRLRVLVEIALELQCGPGENVVPHRHAMG